MISFEDAMAVVTEMEVNMAYFNLSPEGRVSAAKQLMAMVNWPPEKVLRNGYGIVPYVEPKDRLAWLSRQLMKVRVWPGMSEIRGIYCLKFAPADGIEADCDRAALGVTDDGVLVGSEGIEAAPEQKFLPGPDDEPIGEDLQKQIAVAAKRLGSGR